VAGDFKLGIGRWASALLATLLLALPLAATQASAAAQRPAVKAQATAKASDVRKARSAAQPHKSPERQVRPAPRRPPSIGTLSGLHATDDPLDLKSAVALVVDQDTDEVLFSKNSDAVLPIASITKLMTALVVTEAGLSMDETLTVTQEDVRGTAGSGMRSRLAPGTRLTRGELLHLALMSSENRAAHVLGRTYPGGLRSFIAAMNGKAQDLGMNDTRYVEPTGLSADNRSSAQDLAQLVRAASQYPILRELSTMPAAALALGRRQVQFRNTNGLVHNPEWEIGLQKTGYISAAGRCVVMQAELAGRKLIMVLLDSAGRYSRIGDAERLRKWIAEHTPIKSLMPGSRPAQQVPGAAGALPPEVHSAAWRSGAEGGRAAAPAPGPEVAEARGGDIGLVPVEIDGPLPEPGGAGLRLLAYPR
jgi:D-alanyl-D-alanine endopeptidase (penicillin-binding protein 7)